MTYITAYMQQIEEAEKYKGSLCALFTCLGWVGVLEDERLTQLKIQKHRMDEWFERRYTDQMRLLRIYHAKRAGKKEDIK